MGNNDGHVREVDGNVVEVHRTRVLEAKPPTAPHPRADTGMAAVENDRQLVLGDHLLRRIRQAVVRKEPLHGRVEFESADDAIRQQGTRFTHAHLAFMRIDARKGDHNVRILARGVGYLLVRDATRPRSGLPNRP